MGFGILFFGYFLLLNITYYVFTDVVSGLLMAYALFKISSVSSYFKRPLYLSIAFAIFGLVELVLGGLDLFGIISVSGFSNYMSIVRAVILCLFTVLLLRAMLSIAKELEVKDLPVKCAAMSIWTVLYYVAEISFNTGFLANLIPDSAISVIYLVLIIASIMLPIANLTAIFSCYRWICLPEDLEREPVPFFPFGKKDDETKRNGKK